jgi:hypothetical protein
MTQILKDTCCAIVLVKLEVNGEEFRCFGNQTSFTLIQYDGSFVFKLTPMSERPLKACGGPPQLLADVCSRSTPVLRPWKSFKGWKRTMPSATHSGHYLQLLCSFHFSS